MNYWRMAFRAGSRGYEMWPHCYKRGVAVIGYADENGKQIVGDCRKLTEEEYDEIWKRKDPKNIPARTSSKNFAYRMKEGDVIYVKKGAYIVSKGTVEKYDYDPDMLAEYGDGGWDHYRNVTWEDDFPSFKLVLGTDRYTVLKLDGERLSKIRKMESHVRKDVEAFEAKEGERYRSEATFRARNRALIEAKKAKSDYRCEVCEMSFKEVYGEIGGKYIIAHHVIPIGGRKSASKTTLDDIALVCANCHDMLHRKDPPMTIGELRRRYRG